MELTINDKMHISALQQSALGMAVGEKRQSDSSLTKHLEKKIPGLSGRFLVAQSRIISNLPLELIYESAQREVIRSKLYSNRYIQRTGHCRR